MHRKFISVVVSAALVLSSISATAAQAGDRYYGQRTQSQNNADAIAATLFGIAALAIIGKAIDDNNKHKPQAHAPAPRHQPKAKAPRHTQQRAHNGGGHNRGHKAHNGHKQHSRKHAHGGGHAHWHRHGNMKHIHRHGPRHHKGHHNGHRRGNH